MKSAWSRHESARNTGKRPCWPLRTVKRSAKSAQTLNSARHHSIAEFINTVFAGVQLAVSRGLTIMPLRLEQIEPTRSMAYYMAGVHWIDALTLPLEGHFKRMVKCSSRSPTRGTGRSSRPRPSRPLRVSHGGRPGFQVTTRHK